MKEENRLWVLIGRKLAGEITVEELVALEELVQKDPTAQYYMEILSLWWNMAERSGKEEAEKFFNDLLRRLEKKNVNVRSDSQISKKTNEQRV